MADPMSEWLVPMSCQEGTMKREHHSSKSQTVQYWSWKACACIVSVAVILDVLVVRFPLVFFVALGMLTIGVQLWSAMSGLTVVIFTCGLLSYSPAETGVLSRLYPGNVAIAIFVFAWLVKHRPWSFGRLFQPDLINRPLFGMAIVMLLSMLWSRFFPDSSVAYTFPHSDVSWATAQVSQLGLLAATICVPFAVSATIRNWQDVQTIVIAMGIVVSLGTLLTVAALIFGFGGTYDILGATRAYWEQPWHASVVPLSAIILPFLYSGVLFGRRSFSLYGLICVLFGVCFIGVVISFSRETWLIAFGEVLLLTALRLRWRITRIVTCVTVALALFAILSPNAISLVTRFYNPDEVYGLDRVFFYVTALQLIMAHPFLGVGAGNYQFFDRTYAEVSAGGIAHNQFLTVAAETGILGFVLFLWLLVSLLRMRRKFFLPQPQGCPNDAHYWMKAAGSVFVLVWIAECFFGEVFFVTAAEGGGTKPMTAGVFSWILLGVLFAVWNLSQRRPGTESSSQ
jgi:O-antigen ligase